MTLHLSHQISGAVRMAVLLACLALSASATARTADFNRGWKFTKGDPADAEQLVFDDLAWETVRTPHDWAISGPFDPEVDGHAAKLPWHGVGWYRKWLMIDRREEGSRVYLDFDGVMASPQVYVNGELAGAWDYGYTPFRVDLTPHVRFGRANVVAVRVDTTKMATRWYPGAGIYRKATLTVSPPVHLAHHGTFVTTPEIEEQHATVVVTNEIVNHLDKARGVRVAVRLLDPDGSEVGKSPQELSAEPGATGSTRHAIQLDEARLWDVDDPALYTAVTELLVDGVAVERRETPFGVRTARFTADDGFWLNGRRVQLRGVNLHHDLGPLGAAFNLRAAERQLQIMQSMGVNAIRTSHNPPAEEVLDLCDRLGLLVWDELFDKWDATSGRVDGEPGFEEHVERHAASLLRRDRNHPSVIVWSIGNEIVNQPHAPEGKSRERIAFARNAFLRHDPTRAVGLGCFIPDTALSDTLTDLDVAGWNYQRRYALFRERFGDTPIVYSESASALSTRGFYELPLPTAKCEYPSNHQVNAYELSSAPWSDVPEIEFERLRKDSYLAGEFVWTGFDYLGEPTPFSQVARSSYFGIVDLVGLPKDRYYLYRSVWRPEEPTVHLAPHWNWPGHEGAPVPVTVYTNGDAAELFVNGVSQGVRKKGAAPAQPTDLAADALVSASSSRPGAAAPRAVQPESESGWEPLPDDSEPWLEIDLEAERPLRTVALRFPRESKHYSYVLEASDDGVAWRPLVEKEASMRPRWGGVPEAIHPVDTTAQKVRIRFGPCLDDASPALSGVSLYEHEYESTYYRPLYDYRLRWNDVAYQPGELRAVAYRDGTMIGEATVRTADEAARIVLSVDRAELTPDGQDLAFITATAVDAAGNVCPLADHQLTIAIEGVGELAGADNGDPLSLDPFQDDAVPLFYGKAVFIVRATEGTGGSIDVRVTPEGLHAATLKLEATR